ncbi:hypothetical protein [Desulfosporosinus metallidurans]|uniref:Mobile element protein n=1 Tax=Desulfosporosinus metallidurans TaxID=1888891 RepID=A0A1Q8QFX7_9FIRM|nr:hypothetical protein [Desulfosporosinus metallidurans]OLN26246.1 Mobile element protein [Desulfosporosinus metallidurans]
MSKSKTPSYVLTLKLNLNKRDEDILTKRFEIARNLYNACLSQLLKRHDNLIQSKAYRILTAKINKVNQKIYKDSKNKPLPDLKEQQALLYKEMKELYRQFGLSEYQTHDYVKLMQHHFKKSIDSNTAQKIASEAWGAINKLLTDNQTKKVHFKKFGELMSVEGKTNTAGIRYKNNQLQWLGLNMSVIAGKNDRYAQVALLDKVKYCRISRKWVKDNYKYYLQLILEGIPPVKEKHVLGEGRVGLDIGTQTIGIVGSNDVKLIELAPNVVNIDKEIRRLNRHLDRSRRATNPENFNIDGTVKRGIKLQWVKSKKYLRIQGLRRHLYRKQADLRSLSHNILANHILSLGNEVYVEEMNFKALQKRSKKTEKNDKGNFKRKKRFGKSLAKKAPAKLLTILDNKLKWQEKRLRKISTRDVKASQYNHLNHQYQKKKLSERWNALIYMGQEIKIQRDLYSAFLIMNVDKTLTSVNQELCTQTFDKFLTLHDEEILRLRNNAKKNISSMGIAS